jgi:hypothetical protein
MAQCPEPGDPEISVVNGVLANDTKIYQAFYRNAAAWCNAATFNITSAYRITWQ